VTELYERPLQTLFESIAPRNYLESLWRDW
jgi:hypothetical protein